MAEIRLAGIDSLIIYLGDTISETTSARVAMLTDWLRTQYPDLILELTPSYTSVLVRIDLLQSAPEVFQTELADAITDFDSAGNADSGRRVELPVWYDASVGPDLERVAAFNSCSVGQVIEYHTAKTYRVCALGFSPGFAYMAQVDERIRTPRLDTPRRQVPRGAVALAESQTAVYPQSTPGGWNLLGLCPVPMFDRLTPPYSRVQVGDQVRFRAIDEAEYRQLEAEYGVL